MACARKSFGIVVVLAILTVGCGRTRSDGTSAGGKTVIRVEGSDTMVNLAQAWAEEYNQLHPDMSIQVSGGGSGVGIASIIEGVADVANASRKMKDKEMARAKQNTGKTPVEFVVALDALAVYVHKDNPIDTISIKELAEIYGDGGGITKWSQLNVQNKLCGSDEITRVGRQNNSGTYHYFREAVLGDARDYKLGSIDQSGSKDVVALISRTPCAIGYSGMGYLSEGVKWLKISKKKGETGVEPGVQAASDGSYPIARPLQIYTSGEPTGAIKEYLDWIQSSAGQKIVLELGYVPLEVAPEDVAKAANGAAEPATRSDEEPAQEIGEPTPATPANEKPQEKE
ncbi:MAG: PstS family phosphate ABC transporter substrate-binding protein [Pirellulaceae bacterium]